MSEYPLTLIWPGDMVGLACIVGQYERLASGEIRAEYCSQRELAGIVAVMLDKEQRRLEIRLERGLGQIRICRDEKRLTKLLGRWDELIRRHQMVVGHSRIIMGMLER